MCRVLFLITIAVMLVAAPGPGIAAPASQSDGESPLAELGIPEVAITVSDDGFAVAAEVSTGRVLATLDNSTEFTIDAAFVRLPEGVSRGDVEAAFQSATTLPPPWFYEMVAAGGPVAGPGGIGRAVIDLTPGAWAIVQTDPTIAVRSAGIIATGEPPTSETEFTPVADLTVRTGEYGFSFPPEIAAGRQVWKVINAGTRPHLIALSSYPEAVTAKAVAESLRLPATGTPTADGLDPTRFGAGPFVTVQSAGVTSWVEIDLAPGFYVALCFVPDADGTLHALKGMIDVVTAT